MSVGNFRVGVNPLILKKARLGAHSQIGIGMEKNVMADGAYFE